MVNFLTVELEPNYSTGKINPRKLFTPVKLIKGSFRVHKSGFITIPLCGMPVADFKNRGNLSL